MPTHKTETKAEKTTPVENKGPSMQETNAKVEPEVKPEVEPEVKPEVEPEAKPEVVAETKPAEATVQEPAPTQESAPQKQGKGCSLPGCGCKSCACLSCLGIILIIVLFGAILFFRPPFIWNAIKSFLNDGYNPPTYDSQDSSAVVDNITKKVEAKGTVEITEKELQALLRSELGSSDVRIDVEPSYLRIASDIDDNEEHPLWLIIELAKTNDNKLKITKIGFERIDAPDFLGDAITDSAFQALDLSSTSEENDEAEQLVSTLIDAKDQGISLESVRFDKDKITIVATK